MFYMTRLRHLAAIVALFSVTQTAGAADLPQNLVQIDATLTTSAQPSAAFFATLEKDGYGMVINLAPPQSEGSLPNEGALVGDNGLIYINIPVDWHHPTASDLPFFVPRIEAQRTVAATLLHCQLEQASSSVHFRAA